MGFVWYGEKVIIPLYNNNWSVFIVKTQFLLCGIVTKLPNIVQIHFIVQSLNLPSQEIDFIPLQLVL